VDVLPVTKERDVYQRCVCATLRKATRSVTQLFDDALRPSGLRATQFNILSEIRGAGEATVTELTKHLVMDQTTVTRSLALLEKSGLLRTLRKADGRLKTVQLTKKGERSLELARPLWTKAQKTVVKAIGVEVWALLADELDQLAR
jgi:DNA-binding MarR family transcriptional regulator